jgi:hypothetical protein
MEPGLTRVEMTPETAAELLAQGGHLYIWDSGPKTYCRTTAPDGDFFFNAIAGDGWTVHVQRDITPPSVWVIRFKRFPRRHFEALHDGFGGWGDFSLLDVIGEFLEGVSKALESARRPALGEHRRPPRHVGENVS